MGIFSLTAPIGIVVGMVIVKMNKLVDVIFLSISGGTFLYVACSEIIVHEFKKGHTILKLLTVLFGGAIITCLWFFGGHAHEEAGGMEVDAHDDHGHL